MPRHLAALAGMSVLATTAPVAAAEQDDLKAAIVFNIIRFTRFAAAPRRDVILCVVGPRTLPKAFEQVDGRLVPDGRLSVRLVSRTADLRSNCTIAYFPNEAIAPGGDGPPMTIGEGEGFTARGGTVGLRRFGRQIAFDINTGAGARQGVRFSARLLNLAALVRSR